MKKLLAIMLIICLCAGCLAEEAAHLSFSDSVSIEKIRSLDGKTVTITGYMATLSPISGKYIYLMNLPYQSCPFCVPNSSMLANTIAVYAKSGDTIEFTDRAVRVTGRMQVGSYTDDFGYEYNYRIVDAVCEDVDLSGISQEYALWQSIAQDGLVAEVNSMFDYLYFLCCWNEYTLSYMDDNGDIQCVNMYPGDALNFLADDGPYGYLKYTREDYFPSLIRRAEAISDTELSDLTQLIEDSKQLETWAMNELTSFNCVYDAENDSFTPVNADEQYSRWYDLYLRFSAWLARWEM